MNPFFWFSFFRLHFCMKNTVLIIAHATLCKFISLFSPLGYPKVAWNGSVYEHITTSYKNFTEAEQACVQWGGHLASITSQAENELVISLSDGNVAARWTGAQLVRTSTPQVAPFVFSWTDGTPYVDFQSEYANCDPRTNCLWQRLEPNDANGQEGCVAIGKIVGTNPNPVGWNDVPCNSRIRYVCEKPSELCF